jgi:DNA-binding response OmpR family regulator
MPRPKGQEKVRRILLVEDDADIKLVMKDALADEGYQVNHASNGREALELLEGPDLPCIILLDWNMPIMNGQEFLAEKAKRCATSKIPVVILSASTYLRTVFFEHDFMAKPIDIDKLFALIKKHCP